MASHATITNAPESGAHHRTRRALEARIEEMIALLDEIDGDPDLEEDVDTTEGDAATLNSLTVDDEPGEDDEPSLGWPETFGRRPILSLEGQWMQARGDEFEHTAPERHGKGFIRCTPDDHEEDGDREPDTDAEPEEGQ